MHDDARCGETKFNYEDVVYVGDVSEKSGDADGVFEFNFAVVVGRLWLGFFLRDGLGFL